MFEQTILKNKIKFLHLTDDDTKINFKQNSQCTYFHLSVAWIMVSRG